MSNVTDILSKKERSKRMALIRSTNTGPERIVRKIARASGQRHHLHYRKLLGRPDIVFPLAKVVVFVHGCFWHQHTSSTCQPRKPKSNTGYWHLKLARNVARDKKVCTALKHLGWKVIVIWECQTKHPDRVAMRLSRLLQHHR